MFLRHKVAPIALAALALPAFSDRVFGQTSLDLVDTLLGDPNFSTLVTAIQAVDQADIVPGGLINALKSPGPFTVFAPDDAAFAALPPGALPALLADPPALAEILLYHVLPGEFAAAQVLQGGKQPTLLGPKVAFSVSGADAFVNNSQILAVDTFASNGVVHTIASVLSPNDAPNTLIDLLDSRPEFSLLRAAIEAAGLTDTLDTQGPFTLLAPTNDAFAALPAGVVRTLLQDPAALAELLTYHVIPGSVPAATVVTLDSATTLQGNSVFINTIPGALFIDQATVIGADFAASNGVLHALNRVLDPAPTTLVDFVAANGFLSTLTTAVLAADLAGTLAGDGPFTLFAPTNRAFAQLPAGALDGLLADIPALTNVLLYHVLGGVFEASDVVQLGGALTVQGERVFFQVSQSGGVFVNQSQIVAVDIRLANGVIHLIDAVLLPSGG